MYSTSEIEAWLGRIEDVLDAIGRVEDFLERTSEKAFISDQWSIGALSYQLIIMAEATKALAPGLESRRPEIAWKQVWGMRNILAHEYGKADPHQIWVVATNDLAPLKAALLAERDYLTSC
jgi:uncharacterized protein with HEPN domain